MGRVIRDFDHHAEYLPGRGGVATFDGPQTNVIFVGQTAVSQGMNIAGGTVTNLDPTRGFEVKMDDGKTVWLPANINSRLLPFIKGDKIDLTAAVKSGIDSIQDYGGLGVTQSQIDAIKRGGTGTDTISQKNESSTVRVTSGGAPAAAPPAPEPKTRPVTPKPTQKSVQTETVTEKVDNSGQIATIKDAIKATEDTIADANKAISEKESQQKTLESELGRITRERKDAKEAGKDVSSYDKVLNNARDSYEKLGKEIDEQKETISTAQKTIDGYNKEIDRLDNMTRTVTRPVAKKAPGETWYGESAGNWKTADDSRFDLYQKPDSFTVSNGQTAGVSIINKTSDGSDVQVLDPRYIQFELPENVADLYGKDENFTKLVDDTMSKVKAFNDDEERLAQLRIIMSNTNTFTDPRYVDRNDKEVVFVDKDGVIGAKGKEWTRAELSDEFYTNRTAATRAAKKDIGESVDAINNYRKTLNSNLKTTQDALMSEIKALSSKIGELLKDSKNMSTPEIKELQAQRDALNEQWVEIRTARQTLTGNGAKLTNETGENANKLIAQANKTLKELKEPKPIVYDEKALYEWATNFTDDQLKQQEIVDYVKAGGNPDAIIADYKQYQDKVYKTRQRDFIQSTIKNKDAQAEALSRLDKGDDLGIVIRDYYDNSEKQYNAALKEFASNFYDDIETQDLLVAYIKAGGDPQYFVDTYNTNSLVAWINANVKDTDLKDKYVRIARKQGYDAFSAEYLKDTREAVIKDMLPLVPESAQVDFVEFAQNADIESLNSFITDYNKALNKQAEGLEKKHQKQLSKSEWQLLKEAVVNTIDRINKQKKADTSLLKTDYNKEPTGITVEGFTTETKPWGEAISNVNDLRSFAVEQAYKASYDLTKEQTAKQSKAPGLSEKQQNSIADFFTGLATMSYIAADEFGKFENIRREQTDTQTGWERFATKMIDEIGLFQAADAAYILGTGIGTMSDILSGDGSIKQGAADLTALGVGVVTYPFSIPKTWMDDPAQGLAETMSVLIPTGTILSKTVMKAAEKVAPTGFATRMIFTDYGTGRLPLIDGEIAKPDTGKFDISKLGEATEKYTTDKGLDVAKYSDGKTTTIVIDPGDYKTWTPDLQKVAVNEFNKELTTGKGNENVKVQMGNLIFEGDKTGFTYTVGKDDYSYQFHTTPDVTPFKGEEMLEATDNGLYLAPSAKDRFIESNAHGEGGKTPGIVMVIDKTDNIKYNPTQPDASNWKDAPKGIYGPGTTYKQAIELQAYAAPGTKLERVKQTFLQKLTTPLGGNFWTISPDGKVVPILVFKRKGVDAKKALPSLKDMYIAKIAADKLALKQIADIIKNPRRALRDISRGRTFAIAQRDIDFEKAKVAREFDKAVDKAKQAESIKGELKDKDAPKIYDEAMKEVTEKEYRKANGERLEKEYADNIRIRQAVDRAYTDVINSVIRNLSRRIDNSIPTNRTRTVSKRASRENGRTQAQPNERLRAENVRDRQTIGTILRATPAAIRTITDIRNIRTTEKNGRIQAPERTRITSTTRTRIDLPTRIDSPRPTRTDIPKRTDLPKPKYKVEDEPLNKIIERGGNGKIAWRQGSLKIKGKTRPVWIVVTFKDGKPSKEYLFQTPTGAKIIKRTPKETVYQTGKPTQKTTLNLGAVNVTVDPSKKNPLQFTRKIPNNKAINKMIRG